MTPLIIEIIKAMISEIKIWTFSIFQFVLPFLFSNVIIFQLKKSVIKISSNQTSNIYTKILANEFNSLFNKITQMFYFILKVFFYEFVGTFLVLMFKAKIREQKSFRKIST